MRAITAKSGLATHCCNCSSMFSDSRSNLPSSLMAKSVLPKQRLSSVFRSNGAEPLSEIRGGDAVGGEAESLMIALADDTAAGAGAEAIEFALGKSERIVAR